DIARQAGQLNARLLAAAVPESGQVAGQLVSLPGRAQLLVPPYQVDQLDDESMGGQVRFGRHYLGSNGAVHGGAISLLFDDVLGRLAAASGRPRSRTAYLHVDYRSVTPIEADLQIEARVEKEEGRKRFLHGVLRDRGRLCAESAGLFVALRPGQS
ncbi:MAG TPA: PaaI family thioesterase, partial [Trebonia sp.]